MLLLNVLSISVLVFAAPVFADVGPLFRVEEFLTQTQAIESPSERRRFVLRSIPKLFADRAVRGWSFADRQLPTLDDTQRVIALYLDLESRSRAMTYRDYRILAGSLRYEIPPFADEEPIAVALRVLDRLFAHDFDDRGILPALAPLARGVVEEALARRSVRMASAHFSLPRLLDNLDRVIGDGPDYSARELEFEIIPRAINSDGPLRVRVSFKRTLARKCLAILFPYRSE